MKRDFRAALGSPQRVRLLLLTWVHAVATTHARSEQLRSVPAAAQRTAQRLGCLEVYSSRIRAGHVEYVRLRHCLANRYAPGGRLRLQRYALCFFPFGATVDWSLQNQRAVFKTIFRRLSCPSCRPLRPVSGNCNFQIFSEPFRLRMVTI